MKGTKNPLKNEEGFTLIEIIAVLVIMGILAAVAVPKFFDLQTRAREKAVYTAVSELKVRINQHFASELLDGKTNGNKDERIVGKGHSGSPLVSPKRTRSALSPFPRLTASLNR